MDEANEVLDRVLVDVADDAEHVVHDQPGHLRRVRFRLSSAL